jgi:hypothetical protein
MLDRSVARLLTRLDLPCLRLESARLLERALDCWRGEGEGSCSGSAGEGEGSCSGEAGEGAAGLEAAL